MVKITRNSFALALALAALPSAAHAGTSTSNGTATFNVVNQCSVTGATVDLGTYRATDTWRTVGQRIGSYAGGSSYLAGSIGQEALNFGSVLCTNGTQFVLQIRGTGAGGLIQIIHGGKIATMFPAIKKVGNTTLADNNASYPGTGAHVIGSLYAVATGTGAIQDLMGNVTISFAAGGTAFGGDQLVATGRSADNLTYTLTF